MENWNDARIERIISILLITGVIVSASVVLLGGFGFLFRQGGQTADYHLFRGAPENLRSIAGVVAAAASLDARGLIQLGLLILIATPIARVAFSLVAFGLERDRSYMLLTAGVLAILLYSFVSPH